MAVIESSSPEIYTPEYYQRIAELKNRHWRHLGMQHIALASLKVAGKRPIKRVGGSECGAGAINRWSPDADLIMRGGMQMACHHTRREVNLDRIHAAVCVFTQTQASL